MTGIRSDRHEASQLQSGQQLSYQWRDELAAVLGVC